jgi:hypothetical protein
MKINEFRRSASGVTTGAMAAPPVSIARVAVSSSIVSRGIRWHFAGDSNILGNSGRDDISPSHHVKRNPGFSGPKLSADRIVGKQNIYLS